MPSRNQAGIQPEERADARSIEEGCKRAGVSKATVYEWLKDDVFRNELKRQRNSIIDSAVDTLKANLAKAESLLGCLAISMECESESATGPYYPDVAQIAREMVRRSINGLDSLALERALLRNKVKEEHPVRFALAPCYTTLGYGRALALAYEQPLTYDAAGTDHR